jgi:hypothetical protein
MKTMMDKLTGGQGRAIGEKEYNDLFVKASNTMHGVVGGNKDTRDWGAIMASDDPLATADAATKAMYNPSVVKTVNPETGKDMYNVQAADGTVLRAGYSTADMATAAGANLGVDQPVTDGTATADGSADPGPVPQAIANTSGSIGSGNLAQASANMQHGVPTIEGTTVGPTTAISGQDLNAIQASQIAEGTGQIEGDVDTVDVQTAKARKAAQTTDVDAGTYDAAKVKRGVNQALSGLEAQTAEPTADATVRGQLADLMKDFDEGTPPWASGAMRTAMQTMNARGLGASSMAGQAVVQAAMEAALPIAAADARTTAEFEMQNLNNRQQTAIFKTQNRINAVLSDQAAENASRNFNAQSQNQVNMFNENLRSTVSQFNASQINAIRQFNAGETNAIAKFNSDMKEQRAQFNAKNDVLIQQANVQFRNDMFKEKMKITSTEAISGAQIGSQEKMKQAVIDSERKMAQAQLAHSASQAQLAREQQAEQAALERSFQQEEANKGRALTLLTTEMNADAQIAMAKLTAKQKNQSGFGKLIGTVLGFG